MGKVHIYTHLTSACPTALKQCLHLLIEFYQLKQQKYDKNYNLEHLAAAIQDIYNITSMLKRKTIWLVKIHIYLSQFPFY